MRKIAVFSCPGLGDGLISLHLAWLLQLNGYMVELFHNGDFQQLQEWTAIPIRKYPPVCNIEKLFREYDQIFVSQDLNSNYVQTLIKEGKQKDSQKILVLNPAPSKKYYQQKYYADCCFRPDITMVQNLNLFAQNILKLKKISASSPLMVPQKLQVKIDSQIDEKRKIIIHPTASRPGKNWPCQKFLQLADFLEKYFPIKHSFTKHSFTKQNCKVFFVISEKEKQEFFDPKNRIKTFSNLHDLAGFLLDAALFIGGDSGVGHLASALNVSTCSIFRSYRQASLWRPGWGKNKIIAPSSLIPNIRGFRLRDKKWKSFISLRQVKRKIGAEFSADN